MKDGQLQRLLDLSRKTGDTLVVTSEQDDVSVILSLDRYEELVGGKPTSTVLSPPAQEPSPEPPKKAVPPVQSPSAPSSQPENMEVETQFYLEPVE